MPTTWVFHLSGNSLALLLPEIVALVSRQVGLDERARRAGGVSQAVYTTLRQLVCDNPQYIAYVAPLTVAYLVSHPRFNIYKGRLGALRFAGFGLDFIPHAWTAAALTAGIRDGLDALAANAPRTGAFGEAARSAQARGVAVSGAALASLTLAYETAEWLIFRAEERATGGDHTRMNMEWSLPDSARDACANLTGWLVPTARHAPPIPVERKAALARTLTVAVRVAALWHQLSLARTATATPGWWQRPLALTAARHREPGWLWALRQLARAATAWHNSASHRR